MVKLTKRQLSSIVAHHFEDIKSEVYAKLEITPGFVPVPRIPDRIKNRINNILDGLFGKYWYVEDRGISLDTHHKTIKWYHREVQLLPDEHDEIRELLKNYDGDKEKQERLSTRLYHLNRIINDLTPTKLVNQILCEQTIDELNGIVAKSESHSLEDSIVKKTTAIFRKKVEDYLNEN